MVASFTSPNNVLITQPDKSATLARRVPIAGITSAPGAKNRDGTAGSSASISRSLRGSTRRITHCRPDRWYRRNAEKIHRNQMGDAVGGTVVQAQPAVHTLIQFRDVQHHACVLWFHRVPALRPELAWGLPRSAPSRRSRRGGSRVPVS